MNKQEQERRARLMKMQAERLPEIKRRFEENQNRAKFSEPAEVTTGAAVIFEQAQKRNFNSNFKPGGKDYSARPKKKTNSSNEQNGFDINSSKKFSVLKVSNSAISSILKSMSFFFLRYKILYFKFLIITTQEIKTTKLNQAKKLFKSIILKNLPFFIFIISYLLFF